MPPMVIVRGQRTELSWQGHSWVASKRWPVLQRSKFTGVSHTN